MKNVRTRIETLFEIERCTEKNTIAEQNDHVDQEQSDACTNMEHSIALLVSLRIDFVEEKTTFRQKSLEVNLYD